MSHGRQNLGRHNNWHHTFWEGRWYKNDHVKTKFREHPALVIPMQRDVHNELHRDLCPPPKPTREQMIHILGVVATWEPSQGRLAGVESAMYAFDELSRSDNPQLSKRAGAIAIHLEQQLLYMEEGAPKTPLPVTVLAA